MTPFPCGCTHDGATRCRSHRDWFCHDADPLGHPDFDECPPCRLARLRSVSLSSKATPTRRGAA